MYVEQNNNACVHIHMWHAPSPNTKQVAGKLARLERGKLRNQSEEAVQGAKDVLAQVYNII